MPRLSTTTWDVVDHLKTEEDMALYLEAAFESGDPELISAAVVDITRARERAGLAAEADLNHSRRSPR